MVAAIAATPSLAFAQAGDPFAKATTGAASFRESLTQFALVVGGIGMVACLMLGFFGKLNWKWVSTGIGVSFALAIVPSASAPPVRTQGDRKSVVSGKSVAVCVDLGGVCIIKKKNVYEKNN